MGDKLTIGDSRLVCYCTSENPTNMHKTIRGNTTKYSCHKCKRTETVTNGRIYIDGEWRCIYEQIEDHPLTDNE